MGTDLEKLVQGSRNLIAQMRTSILVILSCALLFCILEGAASLYLFSNYVIEELVPGESFADDSQGISETKHARYDPDLGWINIPSIRVDDIYGPGTYVRINDQGFRNAKTFAPSINERKFRIVCSGDSFTLGYGVSNPDAWCNNLAVSNQDIETINMGQGGYGADQAYLWYKRDGISLDHDLQIFAIIGLDLDRMLQSNFVGYEKPILKLAKNKIVVENVPVPNNLVQRKLSLLKKKMLGSLALAKTAKLAKSYVFGPSSTPDAKSQNNDVQYDKERRKSYPLLSAILSDLVEVNRQKESRLAFVLLPDWEDVQGNPIHDLTRGQLREICATVGIEFIDLTDAFREKGYLGSAAFFQWGANGGHYSVAGNHFVARQIMRRLIGSGIYVQKDEAQIGPLTSSRY